MKDIYIAVNPESKGYIMLVNVKDMPLEDLSELTQNLLELCSIRYSTLIEEKEND